MLSLLYFFETFSQAFGDAPRLFLLMLSYYRMSGLIARSPSHGACEWSGDGCTNSMKTLREDPYPEPSAAPS